MASVEVLDLASNCNYTGPTIFNIQKLRLIANECEYFFAAEICEIGHKKYETNTNSYELRSPMRTICDRFTTESFVTVLVFAVIRRR
jgi:hypothetical protein